MKAPDEKSKAPGGQNCVAYFEIIKDTSITGSPYAYLFVDESQGNDIFSWVWNFGDGSPEYDNQSPLHEFAKPGVYNVCLTIETGTTGKIECQNTYCYELTIHSIYENNCLASFYYYNAYVSNDTLQPMPPVAFSTIYFTNNSQGTIYKWTWSFGDATTSNEENPVHTFQPGRYNVCLSVDGKLNSSGNCQDQYCQTIEIAQPTTCYANFFGDANPNDNTDYTFYDASSGSPDKWFWDFGDNSTSSLKNPEHKFANSGVYNICLTIQNDTILCKDLECQTFIIGKVTNPCQAEFIYFPDSTLNLTYAFAFKNISSGNPTDFIWDFGDGSQQSTEENPSHIFPGPGVHNVCLDISDSLGKGCSGSYCQTIFADYKPSNCKAYFDRHHHTSTGSAGVFHFKR